MNMVYFGKTDIGKKRRGNQDNFGIYSLAANAVLCAVCDGMGGAAGGEEASRLALEAFSQSVKDVCLARVKNGRLDAAGLDLKLILANAAEAANVKVFQAAKENKHLNGMGTTLVALFIIDGTAYSINVGDSRMYRVNADGITQLTHDHSYVQYLVDMGKLTPDEARKSSNRNIITRAVGIEERLEADIEPLEIASHSEGNTYFLLCSDGLTSMVSDSEIESTVHSDRTIEEKVTALIEAANRNGGSDNITAVILEL